MGNSKYSRGTQVKEKARQQKQIEKASKRLMAKQQKDNMKTNTPNAVSDIAEPGLVEEIVKT